VDSERGEGSEIPVGHLMIRLSSAVEIVPGGGGRDVPTRDVWGSWRV
jgi:hypothetical protein